MGTEFLICILLAGIGLIILLITKFKLHAFLALILAALFMALCTGVPLAKIIPSLEEGVGGTLGFIALVIGLGSILGKMLEVSGGANVIAQTMIRKMGQKRASWAMMLVGFIAGIPVFSDVGFVLLVPLVFVVARSTGLSYIKIGVPLALSLHVIHCIVPPHPAATAITASLGADMGLSIFCGIVVAFIAAVAGTLYITTAFGDKISAAQLTAANVEVTEKTAIPSGAPGFGITMFSILLPLFLMIGKTVLHGILSSDSSLRPFVDFIGNAVTALLISVFFAYYSLGLRQGKNINELLDITSNCFGPIAGIILIIGAGGAFNAVIVASGVGVALSSVVSNLPLNIIVLAWLIALILHLAVGSSTVAMLSTAGLMLPLLNSDPTISREALVIAIGAGAIGCAQVTDSLFWMVKEYFELTLTEAFKSYFVATTIASIIGLVGALIVSAIM